MLASFVLFLQPQQAAPLGHSLGRSLHGLFMELIRQASPELAQELHAPARAKPFTISSLQGRFSRAEGRLVASPEETYWVRYTALSEPVFATLSHILLGKVLYRDTVTLEGQPFTVTDIAVEPKEGNPWGGLSTFEWLYERAYPERQITLGFYSPTTFRQGDHNLPLPVPLSVFGGYLYKWRAFCDIPLSEGLLDFVEEQVVVERYRIQTKVMRYSPHHQFVGFTGECTFRVLGEDEQHLREVNGLADFAFYAGTGQKTTQGMGQTRRIG